MFIIKKFRLLPKRYSFPIAMFSVKTIGTHSGNFHCDEVLACTMLTRYTSVYKNAEITRTRDLSILSKLDIVVDVGGIYDPSTNRFDHHQKEFQDKFSDKHSIRLSSAGLIYKHFGKEVLKNLIEQKISKDLNAYDINLELTEAFLDMIYYKIYDNFIQAADAIDNGVGQFSMEGKNLEPNYTINSDLGYRISRMNPSWTEKKPDENAKFKEAMNLADEELTDQVKGLIISWWPARPIVQEAIDKRFEISKSGVIIKLRRPCPWKDHLTDIEKINNLEGNLKFVLFPEGPNGNWRVQGINLKGSFALRCALKENWRGVNDFEKLKEVSGIEDIIFCHASGFIGGAKSLESVIKMAELSLN